MGRSRRSIAIAMPRSTPPSWRANWDFPSAPPQRSFRNYFPPIPAQVPHSCLCHVRPRRSCPAMRIGVDFDNPLVCYDRAFAAVGKEAGLLPADFTGGKDAAKRWLYRERPDGYLWERLQGLVYGQRIDRAEVYHGAAEFFRRCRERNGWQVYVVSHKTLLAHHDRLRTDLREGALAWMRRPGFLATQG